MENHMTDRPLGEAALKGLRCKCPNCGKGKVFAKFLKIAPECAVCGEDLSHHEADDMPAYLSIFLTGHIIVPLILYIEVHYKPELWLQMTLWPTISLFLCLAFLPPLKGMVVAIQWAAKMHGFKS
jgi:uncharacterized protein (DUF983 family)